jgi:hypothetical protein
MTGAVAAPAGRPRRCCISQVEALSIARRTESDHQSEFVERDGQPPHRWFLNGQFVVTSPKVLDERMPRDDHPGAVVLLESSHWSQPRLQAAVVGLDPVVGILLSAMPCEWHQLLQYRWVHGA